MFVSLNTVESEKQQYLSHVWSDKGFNGSVEIHLKWGLHFYSENFRKKQIFYFNDFNSELKKTEMMIFILLSCATIASAQQCTTSKGK